MPRTAEHASRVAFGASALPIRQLSRRIAAHTIKLGQSVPVPYFVKKRLLQFFIALPTPRTVDRLLRLWVDTKAGENFGDMTINGEFDFLDAHAPQCRVLFDVGASDGVWTVRALRANPGARIHCFEPMRAMHARLLARRLPANVTCVASGLSDAAGTLDLFTASRSVHDRRGPGVEARAEGDAERITVTTIDDYCARQGIAAIDLLKIDTEGHDLAVLRGGARMIREGRVARIQFEYGPRNVYARVFLRDFFMFFTDLPYTLYQVMPGRLAPVTYSHRLENLQYKNFVALAPSARHSL
jgi:FkbM family methyltransferase